MKKLGIFFFFLVTANISIAQSNDSASSLLTAENPYRQSISDSTDKTDKESFSQVSSWILKTPNATKFDIEQPHFSQKATWEFVWIILFLITLTILRTSFSRQLNDLFVSVSKNSFSQSGLQPSTFARTFLSIVLFIAFVINCSILTAVAIQYFYPKIDFNTTHLLLLLIFLFTFFFATKTIAARTLGYIFDERVASSLYIENLFTITKILAISTFPLVMFFYVAEKKFFPLLITIFIVMIIVAVLVLIWRWLSTSAELLYKSAYHFLLYVCVAEILVVFLFFKLLTKNAF